MRRLRLATALALAAHGAAQQGVVLQVGDDARTSRFVACFLRDGDAPSALVGERGPVTFRGLLDIALRDRFTFTAETNGAFVLAIDGQPIELGKPAKLTKGKLKLEARWTPPAQGDAFVRLCWECSEWAAEPIAPKFLSHDPADPVLARSQRLRAGRELFAKLGCAHCHEPERAFPSATSMPELAELGPSLSEVAHRLEVPWIAKWIEDPQALRPTARMPKLVADAQQARDIAAFLLSFGEKPPADPRTPPEPDAVAAGGKLFAALGCIGCHTRPDDATVAEGRISLRGAAAKFRPTALVEFLKDPTWQHSATRMPKFGLTDAEARQLAAYLRAHGTAPLADAGPPPDLQRGRELVVSLGCGKCHFGCAELVGKQPPLTSVLPKAATADCARARYPLTADERAALRAFLATGTAALYRDSRAEYAERQFQELRCFACHARDRVQDQVSQLGAEIEALAPQGTETVVGATRPALTWVGEKLRPEHVESLLLGTVEPRARPWLKARMPAWPTRAHGIAEGLALLHGCPPAVPIAKSRDADAAALGKKLVSADGGFTCIQCHAIGPQKATQVFEVEGIDFALSKERLRPDYFRRWLWNPLRLDPATKMPRYVDKQGKTQLLDGDATKQVDAIWQFLLGL